METVAHSGTIEFEGGAGDIVQEEWVGVGVRGRARARLRVCKGGGGFSLKKTPSANQLYS